MSVSREQIETAPAEATDRREWVRPAVLQLAAGCAETGSNVVADLAVTYS